MPVFSFRKSNAQISGFDSDIQLRARQDADVRSNRYFDLSASTRIGQVWRVVSTQHKNVFYARIFEQDVKAKRKFPILFNVLVSQLNCPKKALGWH